LTAAVQKGHVAVVGVLLNCERVRRGMLDDHGKGLSAKVYAKKSGNAEMVGLFERPSSPCRIPGRDDHSTHRHPGQLYR